MKKEDIMEVLKNNDRVVFPETKPSRLEDIDSSYSGVTRLIDGSESEGEEFTQRCAIDILELEEDIKHLNQQIKTIQGHKAARITAIEHVRKHLHKQYPIVIGGDHSILKFNDDGSIELIALTFPKKISKHS